MSFLETFTAISGTTIVAIIINIRWLLSMLLKFFDYYLLIILNYICAYESAGMALYNDVKKKVKT